MEKIRIVGKQKLFGSIPVSGSKNAALPILMATLMTDQPCILYKVPLLLDDIKTTLKLLHSFNVDVSLTPETVRLQSKPLHFFEAPSHLVKNMRASALVLGPLLARYGKAIISLPGGCSIGSRPINFHLHALEQMGATIDIHHGRIEAKTKGLQGTTLEFPQPSVGATENILMAAVLAKGDSTLKNCAQEPEIIDLAHMLIQMGARIEGAGTSTIHVQGVSQLQGCTYTIMPDRLEAATFLVATLATGGDVTVQGISPCLLTSFLDHSQAAGATVHTTADSIQFVVTERPIATSITTAPFPGFPTDLQAQFMAAMTISTGKSIIHETIFENRFMHVAELQKLGAFIQVYHDTAQVTGVKNLQGAYLKATDIRASAGLIIAALCAKQESIIDHIYHLDRGYEKIELKFQQLGALIERIPAVSHAQMPLSALQL